MPTNTTDLDTPRLLETLPKYSERIASEDGQVNIAVNPLGSQVLSGEIGGRPVLYPSEGLHSVLFNDPRTDGNPTPMGETKGAGGTWPSFGGGNVNGVLTPVHGPFSAPWNRFAIEERTGDSITMNRQWRESFARFFRPGERYSMRRKVMAVPAIEEQEGEGSIVVATQVTSESDESFDLPEFAEHSYYASNPNAAILDISGNLIPISQGIAKPFEKNSNYLDIRIDSNVTGMHGRCVFLPEGEEGYVIVIDADLVHPSGDSAPVETYCLYRAAADDMWTAVEPIIGGIDLQKGQSVSMIVAVRTFKTLGDYMASLPQ